MAFVHPFKKYNYILTIESIGSIGFSEVSAPEISMDPIEYREGNYTSSISNRYQGLMKYGNVTLKWGATNDKNVFFWIDTAKSSTIDRHDVTITLNGDDKRTVAEWTLKNAFPINYTTDDFQVGGNDIAIESLELSCESITRTK